jgi:hypothetical protein
LFIFFLGVWGTIVSAGVLSKSTSVSPFTKSTPQLSVTNIQTMPNKLILDLFNNGSTDITINQIIVNGTVQTGKVFYDTWNSNVPANIPTTIVFNYHWLSGNEYEIGLVYSEGQTTVLALT